MKKNYPKKLQEIASESNVTGIQNYPSCILEGIENYQTAHKAVHGSPKLTRNEIAQLLMYYGLNKLAKETDKLNATSQESK